jgi:hypothetical protein
MDLATFKDWLAICENKARYCRYLDTKQWDAWTELFTEDYELDVSEESGLAPVKGRTEAINMVKKTILTAKTAHQVHTPEIVIKGDEAHAIWAMQDHVSISENGPVLTGYGHYHEKWVRQNGEWKIATLKLTRLHRNITPRRDPSAA